MYSRQRVSYKTTPRGRHKPQEMREIRERQAYIPPLMRRPPPSFVDDMAPLGWTGIFCLLVIVDAILIAALQTSQSNAPKHTLAYDGGARGNSTVETMRALFNVTRNDIDRVREVCTDASSVTFNKPNITLGMRNGVMLPKSCVLDERSHQCQKEADLLYSFSPNFHVLDEMRYDSNQAYLTWQTNISKLIASLKHLITTPAEMEAVDKMQAILNFLKQVQLRYLSVQQVKAGNCGEHTLHALFKLIHVNLNSDHPIKLQQVSVLASTSGNPIVDHTYLLINSDVADVEITADEGAVSQYLNSIRKGQICDPWNGGYHSDLAEDDSGFYKDQARWDYLKVRSVSLDLRNLNVLSKEIRRYFCCQFAELGLQIEDKVPCPEFASSQEQSCSDPVSASSAFALRHAL